MALLPITISMESIRWFFDKIMDRSKEKHQGRKDRFEKIFDPVFTDMGRIHSNYTQMFNGILINLPLQSKETGQAWIRKFDNNQNVIDTVEGLIGDKDYLENLKTLKRILDDERDENDYVRIEARSLSGKIIKDANNEYEKYFCWAIIAYFLDHRFFLDKKDEDKFLQELIELGPDHMIDTPSHLVSEQLFKSNDADEIKEFIKSIKLNLHDKFTEVTSTFLDLKLFTFE